MQGGLNYFQEHCQAAAHKEQARQGLHVGTIEGTPRQAAAANKKISDYNRIVRACSMENLQSAASSLVQELGDNQLEVHVPRWLS